GGSVMVPYYLSRELSRIGHEVTIITTDFEFDQDYLKSDYLKSIEREGVKVVPFRCVANMFFFLFSPSMKKWLQDNVQKFGIIHMHNFRTYQNIIAHHYLKEYEIPYVLQTHGSVLPFFQKQRLKKLYDRVWGYRILKDASKVIAVTKMEAEQYKSMGVSEDKIEIIPNGIDLSEFENLPKRGKFRKKWGIDESQKIILYLGRIHQTKGMDLLVKAFAELSKDSDDVKLVIAGPDDGYLPALKKLIKELKIGGKVVFTGPLYGTDKLRAHVDADVFVNPRADEIFGLVFLEASACGTPVICSQGCGIADVIDGHAGLAVPYDKDQLRDAIIRILNDKELQRKFGEEGKRLVREEFGWDEVVRRVEEIYENCTSQTQESRT
ncbi:glycosyltransferase, partial [Dehalococcoidia bacterium]|nr:glycosyltransferase [Dehalococcoidia bacterium]